MPLTLTTQLFEQNTNSIFAESMKQYMRNQYEFYGIKAPLRKELLKQIEQEEGRLQGEALELYMLAAWEAPYREVQHIAMDRMYKVNRKLTPYYTV